MGIVLSVLAVVGTLAYVALRPPYGYLRNGELSFIATHPTGEIYEEYTFDSNLDPIVAQAKIEHRGKWKDGGYGGTKPGMRRIRTHAFVGKGIGITFTGRTPTTGSDLDQIPDNKTGIVRVIRRANVVDRMREWFFRRKWKGARP